MATSMRNIANLLEAGTGVSPNTLQIVQEFLNKFPMNEAEAPTKPPVAEKDSKESANDNTADATETAPKKDDPVAVEEKEPTISNDQKAKKEKPKRKDKNKRNNSEKEEQNGDGPIVKGKMMGTVEHSPEVQKLLEATTGEKSKAGVGYLEQKAAEKKEKEKKAAELKAQKKAAEKLAAEQRAAEKKAAEEKKAAAEANTAAAE